MICFISTTAIAQAENPTTLVRVQDVTGVEGIAGVVLLVNPGGVHNSKVFITDTHGLASVPRFDCSICIITAMDPRGSFFDKTTEFDGQSSSLTMILEIRPTIDKFWTPGSLQVNVILFGPSGDPLPNQDVVIRPAVMMLDTNPDTNGFHTETTDPKGLVIAELLPGKYVIATLIGGKPWEAPLRIAASKSKCPAKTQKCIDSEPRGGSPKRYLAAHLSAAGGVEGARF
jgi:hypothetical protein